MTIVAGVAVVAGLAAGCGTSGTAPQAAASGASSSSASPSSPSATPAVAPTGPGTFATADDVVSALQAHGAPCTAGSEEDGGTSAGSLNPYVDCTGHTQDDTSIVVFTSHADALAFAYTQLAVTNLGPVAEVVGANWVVNTVPAYARKAARAIGGRLLISQASIREARAARARARRKAAAERRRKAAARERARLRNTVEFIVTGSSADVIYGPSGSNFQGSVPLDVSEHIPPSPPEYYAISAQLNGSGAVSCEIKIGGAVISHGAASGGYNIASCEVVQDPIDGGWEDANSG